IIKTKGTWRSEYSETLPVRLPKSLLMPTAYDPFNHKSCVRRSDPLYPMRTTVPRIWLDSGSDEAFGETGYRAALFPARQTNAETPGIWFQEFLYRNLPAYRRPAARWPSAGSIIIAERIPVREALFRAFRIVFVPTANVLPRTVSGFGPYTRATICFQLSQYAIRKLRCSIRSTDRSRHEVGVHYASRQNRMIALALLNLSSISTAMKQGGHAQQSRRKVAGERSARQVMSFRTRSQGQISC